MCLGQSKESLKFIESLGYRETSFIAFRCGVAAGCRADVTTEDAVKGVKSHSERSDAVARNHQDCQVRHRKFHARCSHRQLIHQRCLGWWNTQDISTCEKGQDGRTTFERLHATRPHPEFVPFGEKVLARPTQLIH